MFCIITNNDTLVRNFSSSLKRNSFCSIILLRQNELYDFSDAAIFDKKAIYNKMEVRNMLGSTSGLSRRPFTPESRVRIPYRVPNALV